MNAGDLRSGPAIGIRPRLCRAGLRHADLAAGYWVDAPMKAKHDTFLAAHGHCRKGYEVRQIRRTDFLVVDEGWRSTSTAVGRGDKTGNTRTGHDPCRCRPEGDQ